MQSAKKRLQFIMKKHLLLLLILANGFSLLAHSRRNDFIVLDYYCPNHEQLKKQYEGQENSIVVSASRILAPEKSATALSGKKVNDLHIFVSGKPGSMVCTSVALTSESIEEFSSSLELWAAHVSGKVVIHSTDVFASERGSTFKSKNEQMTGLDFMIQ